MNKIQHSRRRFLRSSAIGLGGAALGPWAQLQAMAQSAQGNDYRALVCLFMHGGNDGNNLLVPYDSAEHARYARARGHLALNRDTLLPIKASNTRGASYALHPAMPGLQALFNSGQAAMVANIGTLVVPTSKAQWSARSVPLPANLFSHVDQQSQWQSDIYNGPSSSGWGGRMAERLLPEGSSNRSYACVSVGGGNVWGVGDRSMASQRVSPNGRFGFDFYFMNSPDPLSQAVTGLLSQAWADPFQQTWMNVMQQAFDSQRVLGSALKGVAAPGAFPNTDLGRQMSMIAKLISVRGNLGLNRQCFFCSIGGFDTHGGNQLQDQHNKLAEVDGAVSAFMATLKNMGLNDQVTLFSASDFGRTLISNGSGSDHGWGNHHFVVGGGVNGGRIAGKFPQHVLGGADDLGGGAWLPTTSVDQLGRELGRWFGAGANLGEIFPNMGQFDDNLGLMKA